MGAGFCGRGMMPRDSAIDELDDDRLETAGRLVFDEVMGWSWVGEGWGVGGQQC